MLDKILALYWVPRGTPLWRHHLPYILIGTFLLGLIIFAELLPLVALVPTFVVLLVSQFVFAGWARCRFGNKNPKANEKE